MMRDIDRINHMLEAVRKALRSVDGINKSTFLASEDKKAAAERYVILIGEAANMFSDELKEKYPLIPWHKMIGMRNFIAHEYMKVDYDLIWDTVKNDFPTLLPQLEDIAAAYPWPIP